MKSLTMERFYGMVRVVHRHALDHSFWPDLSGIESGELNQILAACHGSKWAVNRLEIAARKELMRRSEVQWRPPLSVVPDPDPLKNKVDI